ncbi:GntR family transcriptional regulator [Hydrogenophaga crassostreae]|uniref:GntR family transcriptional regulator n=1 Tax=Hydrogenophaga crassostreae TaxID=1763535 RepID=A0A162T4K6_9BURK|nr:PLP-dependent aminotransferase family protein [Hydrogenophaga crassostreae]AOW14481.1 GntR family transcriptional regulator [Hydrogenophaga crassostreae]OAD43495.1 GntR family transcriptional regulator [Hydrogenophaga crassostreae]
MATRSNDNKVETLTAKLLKSIEQDALPAGTRLRSVRDAAQKEGLGVNTVVEAYNQLVARGFLESRPGSGFYVRKMPRAWTATPAPHVTAAVDVVSLLREQLEQHYEVRVGDGRPPASWMEGSELGRHLRRSRAEGLTAIEHGYGTPWGYQPLRETVVRLLGERSIQVHARQVLLTQGANHALDLIIRHLLEPGDKVLVDAPGYYPLFGKLKLAKVQMLGVPRLSDGPDLEALHALMKLHRPKVFFTQSLAHNPTGSSISLPKAHMLLRLAAEFDCLVVEDDPFADLLPAAAPRLAALDQLDRVLYVSSFSKTLSAGLRVGYIAGAPERISALCDLKMVTVVSTSDFVERVVHQLISAGQYRRHIARLKARLAEAHGPAVKALERAGVEVHPSDPGGYYLWVDLPRQSDELELVRDAASQGIFLAPGSVFYPDRQGPYPALRVNVAYAGDPRFIKFLRSVSKHRIT